MGLRLVVGADSAGVDYKDTLASDLAKDPRVESFVDVGVRVGEDIDYPHIGVAAARLIAAGEADRALLICGTGIGMAIAANKVQGVRASVAHDSFSVERLVLSNNAQVLCLGARVIGMQLARLLVTQWLGHSFDETSPSAPKVAALAAYDAVPQPDPSSAPGSGRT